MIEGNYTKIPNKVLEALIKAGLNATQYRILWTIIRYTYGFQREDHKLSVSFISESTESNPQAIKRGLKQLIEMDVITVTKEATFSSPRIMKINEDIDTWCIKEYQETETDRGNSNDTSPGNSNDTSPGNSNDTLPGNSNDTQETKKEISKQRGPGPDPDEIEDYFNKIWSLYPNQIGKSNITEDQKEKLYNEVPLNDMVKAITKYKQEIQGREPRFIKHGGNFFSGDYIDYLPPKGQTIPRPKEIKILDYDDKIRQLQEEEERRYQAR